MIKSSNPALNASIFNNERSMAGSETMTIQGTVNKTAILLLILVIAASFTWNRFFLGYNVSVFMMMGGIFGLITALITLFKKQIAHITAPAYVVFQGLFIGGLSATFEAMYPGIVIQAVGLTFSTLFCLLGAYKSGMIKVT